MPRPLLLIVAAESLRTTALVSQGEALGWSVRWLQASETRAFLNAGALPDLLLLEEDTAEEAGWGLARALRVRRPTLPVLMLSDGTPTDPGIRIPGREVQAYLDRAQPAEGFAEALQRFQPIGETRYTTDEIFGDLLEELEALPLSIPEQGQLPVAAVKWADNLLMVQSEAPTLPPAPSPRYAEEEPAATNPLGPMDYTLSGIPGVADPFSWEAPVPPAPRPVARVPLLETGAPEAGEEYGNYLLLEKIAVGGMAELFKAEQRGVQGFQKIVAIKRILPHFSANEDFVTMFIDEAKLAAQLTHPNIVQIFDLGEAGGSYYIAMEYVNGLDLRALLRKAREYGAPFPEQVAAFIVMKVASALDYAHRKRGFDDRELKLVHRDISPQNVILSTEGAVKLVDFGIAKAASKASHTMEGALKGKLLYMSPEQATGQPLDNRSDLYSLGLVLFELLTGERCFQADSELGVLEKVRLGRIADLASLNPQLSREMIAIVNRALQKSVDHRYPSARFLERDLREYLQRQGNPVTEHDVAEYMNTLLQGSRDRLETLVSARFHIPARAAGEALEQAQEGTDTQVARRLPSGPQAVLDAAAVRTADHPQRPRWLLPAILTVALLLGLLLGVALWT